MSEKYMRQYLEEIQVLGDLDDGEVRALADRLPDAGARETLIHKSLIFVAKQAMAFSGEGADPEDLIQEGNMALLQLVDSYSKKSCPGS